jgi:hypothetical protein
VTGASTRCTLLSSTRISIALRQRAFTSDSLSGSQRFSCSICRSRSDIASNLWRLPQQPKLHHHDLQPERRSCGSTVRACVGVCQHQARRARETRMVTAPPATLPMALRAQTLTRPRAHFNAATTTTVPSVRSRTSLPPDALPREGGRVPPRNCPMETPVWMIIHPLWMIIC